MTYLFIVTYCNRYNELFKRKIEVDTCDDETILKMAREMNPDDVLIDITYIPYSER